MESMNTEQLSEWNRELSTLLCMPAEDRENLGWQIAVGDHLEKFAQSWHSSRIAELEAQIAALQEIAVEIYAREIYPFNMPIWEHLPEEDTWVDDKLFGKSKRTGKSTYRYHARDQLAKEHPEAFR